MIFLNIVSCEQNKNASLFYITGVYFHQILYFLWVFKMYVYLIIFVLFLSSCSDASRYISVDKHYLNNKKEKALAFEAAKHKCASEAQVALARHTIPVDPAKMKPKGPIIIENALIIEEDGSSRPNANPLGAFFAKYTSLPDLLAKNRETALQTMITDCLKDAGFVKKGVEDYLGYKKKSASK